MIDLGALVRLAAERLDIIRDCDLGDGGVPCHQCVDEREMAVGVAALVRAAQALSEARPYVYNVACEHRGNWRGQTADDVLSRVDAALDPFRTDGGAA